MRTLSPRAWFVLLLTADLLSFLGHYLPMVSEVAFIVLAGAFLFLALEYFELALLVVLAELFVGSFGYAFFSDALGTRVSIRLVLFLILMAVTLLRVWQAERWRALTHSPPRFWPPVLTLSALCLLAFVNGLLHGNGFSNVFLDANAFFFLGLIVPLLLVRDQAAFLRLTLILLTTCSVYLSLRTLVILYFFTHSVGYLIVDLNTWLRNTRLAEVTWTTTGAYRVFMQSQLFLIAAWWLLLWRALQAERLKHWLAQVLQLSLIAAALLISFSRSYWLGIGVSGLVFGLVLIARRDWRTIIRAAALTAIVTSLGFALVLGVLRIPYPRAIASGFDLSERLRIVTEEAASSRWQLLPPLWKAVREHWLIGTGFGTSVTYVSNDPRVRASSPTGTYTTTAFEWGYLDLWLKLGLLGLAAYAWLLWRTFQKIGQRLRPEGPALVLGLVGLVATNIASPYLNHPLGIGFMLLLYVTASQPLTALFPRGTLQATFNAANDANSRETIAMLPKSSLNEPDQAERKVTK